MKPEQVVKKFKLNRLHWLRKGYQGVLHVHFPVTYVGFRLKKFFGTEHRFILDLWDGAEHGEWNICYEDCVRIRELFLKKMRQDPKYLDKLKKEWEKSVVALLKVFNEVRNTDLRKLSDQDLFDLYEKFIDAYAYEFSLGIGIEDPVTLTVDEFLQPKLNKIFESKGYKKYDIEFFATLTQPVTNSFVREEAVDLAKIKLASDTKKLLAEHVKKYFWIHSNYAHIEWLDAKYFSESLKKITKAQAKLEIKNAKNALLKARSQKTKLIQKLNLDAWTKTLLEVIELFAYIQDQRKKYSMMSNNGIDLFMKEYGRRLKLSYEDMKYTYMLELSKLLRSDKKEIAKLVAKRKKASACLTTANASYVFAGEDATKFRQLIFGAEKEYDGEIKGMTASAGKVSGRVKMILTFQDMTKMQKGDILVASMTRPEIVSAMHKAAAIVTDEGGITSHAAVVSRELRIPCIIGTKFATKILKDGDMVEVDANKGIVRLVSSKKIDNESRRVRKI